MGRRMKKLISIIIIILLYTHAYSSDIRTGGIFGGLVNTIPKYITAFSLGNSSITDDGATITTTEPLTLPNIFNAIKSNNYAINLISGITATPNSPAYILDTSSAMTTSAMTIMDIRTGGVSNLQIQKDTLATYLRGRSNSQICFTAINNGSTLCLKPHVSQILTQQNGVGAAINFATNNGVGSTLNFKMEGSSSVAPLPLLNELNYGLADAFSIGNTSSHIFNIYKATFGKDYYGKNQETQNYYDGDNFVINPSIVSTNNKGHLIISGNVDGGDINNVGANLVSNSTFTPDCTGWTLTTGWTCTNNAVIHNSNGTGSVSQLVSGFTVSTMYLVSFTTGSYIGNNGTGQIIPSVMNSNLTTLQWQHSSNNTAPGTFNITFIATSPTTTLEFTPVVSNARGSLSNITIASLGTNLTMRYPNIIATSITTTNMTTTYGSMYANMTSQTTTVSVTDTYYKVAGSMSDGGSSTGFTFQNSQELLCNVAGKYIATWSMSINTAIANQELEGAVMVNSTAQLNTTSHNIVSASASKNTVVAGSGVITAVIGDTIGLAVSNHTLATDIVMEHANLTLQMVSTN